MGMSPAGLNLIRKEIHFFILTTAGSHNRSETNADVLRPCATPLGLGYNFFYAPLMRWNPFWGSFENENIFIKKLIKVN